MKANLWTHLTLATALLMLVGSLFLSVGLGLKACPLCLYERTFVMGVVGVLAMAVIVRPSPRPGLLALLALPLSVAGLALAGFHVYLDRSGVLDCPAGILGLGHAPDQSLAGYLVLTGLLAVGALAGRAEGAKANPWASSVGGALLGVLLAFASVKSAPPLPPPNPTFGPSGERILSGCEPALPSDSGRGS
jgi:disulfide bond formation protein DsbB